MAGGIGLSKALSLISGVPLAKAGTVLAEKLSLTKRLDGGAIGGLLKQVATDGNLSSIMQNPVAGAAGALQGQISSFVSQLQASSTDTTAIQQALSSSGGLSGALSNLVNSGNNLAGLTPGAAGFFDLLGHNNIVEMFGKDIPVNLTLDAATGPVTAQPVVSDVAAQTGAIVQNVLAGSMSSEDGAAAVNAHTARINGVVDTSNTAIQTGQNMLPMLAVASAVAGALAVPSWSQESPLQAVLGTLVQGPARTTMDAATALQVGPRAGMSQSELIAEVERMANLLKKIRSGT